MQAAVRCAQSIYRPGFKLAKAGVHLLDLQDGDVHQHELELDDGATDRSGLMVAMDQLNTRYGRGTFSVASAGNLDDEAGTVNARLRHRLEEYAYGTRIGAWLTRGGTPAGRHQARLR